MKTDNINYSSHAIIIDDEWYIYLERNKKLWWRISLFWWWLETWETHIDWIVRELGEEVFIKANVNDFKYIETNWPKKFPKGVFITEIYALKISSWVWKIISNLDTVIKIKYDDLSKNENAVFVIEKEEFLWRIEKSLNLLNIKIWI